MRLDEKREFVFGNARQGQSLGSDESTMTQPLGHPRTAGLSSIFGRGHGRGCRHFTRLSQSLIALVVVGVAGLSVGRLAAEDAELQAPLTTVIRGWSAATAGGAKMRVRVMIPADAPTDLGLGVFVEDPHGRWFQHVFSGTWRPGMHELTVPVDAATTWTAQGHAGAWNTLQAARSTRGGLFAWSAQPSRAHLDVNWLPAAESPAPATANRNSIRIVDCSPVPAYANTGQRQEIHFRVNPMPADPYDPGMFSAALVVRDPTGAEVRYAAFYQQPMQRSDRGDREIMRPSGQDFFAARWRPRMLGPHTLALEWARGRADIGTCEVRGPAWDDYVHVDKEDPRFFAAGGTFIWPQGPNLRSVWDLRARDRLDTALTPDRGIFAYDAYLTRAAAGGANACEIWLSAWNLALEWNPRWDGFYGLKGYNENNAERLDVILNRAEELGIRVNLVIHNHGQGSDRTDREWDTSPWNRANGGPLNEPGQLFTDPRALAGQDRLRRYLIARYADSPAILGWKLWSEMNLTAGSRSDLREWHTQACTRFRELDPYRHPLTSHWSGDYRTVDQTLVTGAPLDYICIDAYHQPRNADGVALAELMLDGTTNFHRGLSRLNIPVIVTEYGGNWDAAPEPQIIAEHRSGNWLALMSGYGGGPMLWWFEWIDQGDRWGVYHGLRDFLVGEDLRGTEARTVMLSSSAGAAVWVGSWSRPGRRLGYLLDSDWGALGNPAPIRRDVAITHGDQVPAGPVVVEWWNPDTGQIIDHHTWQHPGGALVTVAPPFQHHLAFKLWRE